MRTAELEFLATPQSRTLCNFGVVCLNAPIDATGQRDLRMEIELLEEHHRNWTAHWTSLPDALRATPIPEESRVLMMQLFETMAQRINHLRGQIAENEADRGSNLILI